MTGFTKRILLITDAVDPTRRVDCTPGPSGPVEAPALRPQASHLRPNRDLRRAEGAGTSDFGTTGAFSALTVDQRGS